MLKVLGLLLAAVVGASALAEAPQTKPVSAESTRTAADWRGSRDAMPDDYSWLDDTTPSDTYTIVVVRGMGRPGVLRHLGGVKRQLSDRTPDKAENYVFKHMRADYSAPRVVQVQRRGHAIVVYAPSGVLEDDALAKMSRRGVAAEFFTDVEWDTYVTVAKKGRVVRSFDAGFKPPKKGALRAEGGLDWGRRHQNIWATAWAFDERLTLTHITQRWFDRAHPTYVAKLGALL